MAIISADPQTTELAIAFSHVLAKYDDPNREGLIETPKRAAKAWDELLIGYSQDPSEMIKCFTQEADSDQMVILKNIRLYSICEHHLLPFFGKAHVAYLPDKHVIGVSKIARIVNAHARKLQIQERLTEDILKTLEVGLAPLGVMVVIEAEHMCMRLRGVREPESTMVTSATSGMFRISNATRAEFLSLINR